MDLFKSLEHLYGEEIIAVSLKDINGKFTNHTVKWKEASQYLKYKNTHDVYFSFTPLKDPNGGRKLSNASGAWCFGVDIDDASIPSEWYPQIVWESSPNKYQGVYIVDHEMSTDEIFKVCKGLSKKFGYDPGSVDAVHLFRMPGSVNHKYPGNPPVGEATEVGDSIAPYRLRDLKKYEDKSVEEVKTEFDYEEVEPKGKTPTPKEVLDETPIVGDRSAWHFNIVAKFKKHGYTQNEILWVLNRTKGTKFTGERLKEDIAKCYARVVIKSEPKEEDTNIFSILPIGEVTAEEPKWLVEGVWGEGNVGLMVAAPKSFKSTFAYDLALSVASGRNFYGHKVKQCGVAILQLENSDYYTKLLLERMAPDANELPIYLVKGSGSLDNIEDLVNALPEDVKFLIVDPLYFAWGHGSIQDEESRTKLRRISDAVKPREIATMLIHHTRKSNEDLRQGDIYGSQFLASWYESLIIINRIKGSDNTVKINADFRMFTPRSYAYTVNSSGMNVLNEHYSNDNITQYDKEAGQQAAARVLGLELIDNELYFKGKKLHV